MIDNELIKLLSEIESSMHWEKIENTKHTSCPECEKQMARYDINDVISGNKLLALCVHCNEWYELKFRKKEEKKQ